MKRVVIADALSAEGVERLAFDGVLEVDDCSSLTREQLEQALRSAAGLIVRSGTTVDAELLEHGPDLEVIGRAGVGLDNIDLDEATKRGIAVVNAPGGNIRSTAELTFGLMLAAARRIPEADRSVRDGRWDRKGLRGTQLHGKTLGVIGAGRIGSEIVRRASVFGMKVLISDPFITLQRARDLGADAVELRELLKRSDFVSLHVPLNDTTAGMIGAGELDCMPPGAFLVNASRGGVVDEEALARALHEGRLAGAALDVYEQEPLPEDSALRTAPGLVMTPHLGASTSEAQREVALEIADAVHSALVHGDLRAAVNAPHVAPADRPRLTPVLALAESLGRLLSEITGSRCDRLEVRYAGPFGDVLRPLAASAVEGYLSSTVGLSINPVNALVLATARGIQVARVRLGKLPPYSNHVELAALTEGREVVVAGALLGDDRPRIVQIGQFHVDTVPSGTLLLIRNQDVPGVIGEVGTILGNAGVNIAGYHQARREAGGEALAVISLDESLDEEMLEQLRRQPGVHEVRQLRFEPQPRGQHLKRLEPVEEPDPDPVGAAR
jgi:D-3-phosphoglycerate dehydrogenase